ncbi:MAG: BtpA/SgcQ family protein [Verrucomicrobia bacterium]|jgi:membrane complex biogenesis BtpA family protein|nr:BtpA/SgcQ family protein [Verrucomicrobiota bacterium]
MMAKSDEPLSSAKSPPAEGLISMIGLLPLPGSPGYGGDINAILEQAIHDAEVCQKNGTEALLIENSGDLPYIKPPLPAEAIGVVEAVAHALRGRFPGPVGLQLLEAANEQAMEVAARTGLDFLRVEAYVFAHIGGAGLIEGCAGRLLRLRRKLRADRIRVYADIRKKHCSHAITGDLPLEEHARQAAFFQADGLIITGPRTGAPPMVEDLRSAAEATRLPVLTGSGMTTENIGRFIDHADGFIVGSTFRRDGAFLGELEPERHRSFRQAFQHLKSVSRDR